VDLPPRFPITPPFVTFNGSVDAQKLSLADNPIIGLDGISKNSSAVFRVGQNFLSQRPYVPRTWDGMPTTYSVYAILPKCKPHMEKKCENYLTATTPFQKHG
ncbi:hypothetical protein CLIM01_15219, partial [Colletotrichum limetticola]